MSTRAPVVFVAVALMALSGSAVAAEGDGPLSGDSVYQIKSTWIDQNGRTVELADFRGKPRLITMAYTSCEYSCPLVVEELRKILTHLPGADRSKVGVIIISFDTERDTPEQLRKFAAEKQLDPPTWILLKGDAGAVREMAVLLGINFKKTAGGAYAHTNAITVLDQEGVIRYRSPALGSDGRAAAAAVEKLLDRH